MPATAHAQPLRLRLFLEGIEVPVIAAQIQCAPNSPSVATIQIPALAEATRLLPRTTVHLFFLDLYSPPLSIQGDRRQSEKSTSPTAAEKAKKRVTEQGETADSAVDAYYADADNTRWKLLFGGEIIGFSWTKNASNRSIILQCEDWSNYWDYALQADNTDIFGPGLKAIFSGSSTNLFTDFLSDQGEILTNIVTSGRCNTFPKLRGLAAGVIRLMEAVGGSYYIFPDSPGVHGNAPKRYAGENIFFSYNELRLHLTQMVGTPSKDPTSEQIMRYQGYSGMFSRALGGQGGQVSIRAAMNAISQIIFYEMHPQPCPKYVAGSYGSVSGTSRVRLKDNQQYAQFAASSNALLRGLNAVTASIDSFGEGPSDATQVATAARELVNTLVLQLADIRRQVLLLRAQMRTVPEPAPSRMSSVGQTLGQALTVAQSIRGGTNPGGVVDQLGVLHARVSQAGVLLLDVINQDTYVGTGSDRSPAQLYQQVFRPDVWFAAPPRCNVFFPESYESLSYQRMFLQEPTRLMLKTNDEFFGEDELFDNFYFAPTAGNLKGERANFTSMLQSQLLLHERFTGILPVFEKMGEFNVFASQAEHRVALGSVSLAQRTANFLYFRHRFNARRMSLTGKFNPYVAVGCPGLVIDKYVSQETLALHNLLRSQQNISQIDADAVLGTNFLGNFAEVVHQVSAANRTGNTTIQMTFARQPEERIDFLGANPTDTGVRQRVAGASALRATVIAALSPPALFSLGPNNGQITNVVDVTPYNVGKSYPYYDNAISKSTTSAPPSVTVGQIIKAGTVGSSELTQALGGADVDVSFSAYTITEEIPRYRKENLLLPAEEYIRPGWYGDVWTNQKVGEIWNELFSTGAITDPTTVNDLGRDAGSQQLAQDSTATSASDHRGDATAVADLQAGCSIQQAVDFLLQTYSYIKHEGTDVDEFIGSYTWRPIATLVDIFGTSDLAYDTTGEKVLQGFEGFHSRAVGPYNDLFGLVDADIETVLNIKRGSTAAQNVDVRKERREQVERYVTALLFGNALLG